MSTEVATQQPRSIVQDMADHYGMDKRAFEATLKATVIPANVSNEQFAAFLLVAKEYKLNPLTKEIWAFPARSGGISPIVSIDGWANIINSHPAMDGLEYEDIFTEGQLSAIKCIIYRKDRSRPIAVTEYLNECKRNTETWKTWPARMLRHKATIQCARMAFGFSGIYDEDEAQRIVDVTPPEAKSLFKNSTLRNNWFNSVVESFRDVQTLGELESAALQYEAKFVELITNGNEHDVLAVDELRKRYDLIKMRFEISDIDASMDRALDGDYDAGEVQSPTLDELAAMPDDNGAQLKAKVKAAVELIKGGVAKIDVLSALGDGFGAKLNNAGLGMEKKKLEAA